MSKKIKAPYKFGHKFLAIVGGLGLCVAAGFDIFNAGDKAIMFGAILIAAAAVVGTLCADKYPDRWLVRVPVPALLSTTIVTQIIYMIGKDQTCFTISVVCAIVAGAWLFLYVMILTRKSNSSAAPAARASTSAAAQATATSPAPTTSQTPGSSAK